jgi:phosphoribosylglycinamide formyltransferase-1
MAATRRLGILISGRGSNMLAIGEAIAAGRLDATIAVVVSSRPGAPGLERAAAAGIPTAVVAPKEHASREACDRAIVAVLRAHDVELVCLAGYMADHAGIRRGVPSDPERPPVAAPSFPPRRGTPGRGRTASR